MRILTCIFLLVLAMPVWAGSTSSEIQNAVSAPHSVTEHRGIFNGKRVSYTANVESYRVSDGGNGPAADLVAISYLAKGVKERSRPVLFVFNGGPISPSIYLHMAAFGPRRVAFPDDLSADPATFQLVDNRYTVLDVADIVFFDPAGTGYSRVAAGVKPDAYFSIDADARQLVQLIQAWSDRHGRTASPKYLFGESYGTLRAATAAQQLSQSQPALRLDGVFLMGQALNIIEMAQRPGNVTSYVVSLPTLSALGWYHGKVSHKGRTFDQLMAQSRSFAQDEYLPALFKGSDLPTQERARIAASLEDLTGLPASVFEARNLRVSKDTYRVELFKDRNFVLGAYDGRYVATPKKKDDVPDGSLTPLPAIFDGFHRYVRDELHVQTPLEYRIDSPVTSGLEGWDWGKSKSPFGDWPYMEAIRQVMERDPKFRVMMAAGYHDTATTIGASEYAVAQSGWPRDRVTMRYYQGGHMAYTIEASLKQMMDDVRTFVAAP